MSKWNIIGGVSVAVIILSVAIGCGSSAGGSSSGEDRVLHLGGYDITESGLRTYFRSVLLEPGADQFCTGLQGLSEQEIIDTVRAANAGVTPSPDDIPSGGTAVPDQTPVPEDSMRAAGIIKAECERIG